MSRLRSAAVLLALASACDNREECEQLRRLHFQHQRALAIGRSRAGLAEKTKRDAQVAEQQAKALMTKYGLDTPEQKVLEILRARVASIPGAAVDQSTRAGQKSGPTDDGHSHADAPVGRQTVWTIRLPTRVFSKAAAHARDLAAIPPALQLATLLPPRGNEGWWVELVPLVVDRLPIKFEPQSLPIPQDPAEVPSKIGFCGADELRKQIKEARAELASLEDKAAKTTVYLPTAASWEGLKMRAQLAVEMESEARRLLDVFFAAAQKAKVKVKAVGQELDVVILEIVGGDRERVRLERHLPDDVLAAVRQGEKKPGVVRLFVANRLSEQMRKPGTPKSVDLGLPTPEALKRAFEEARKKAQEQ